MTESITTRFLSVEGRRLYSKVISNYQNFLVLNIILILLDLTLLIIPKPNWVNYIELALSVLVAITTGWLSSRLFKRFYDTYLQENALSRKINSELLIVINLIADAVIFIIIFFIFAQTHQINVFALTASLGLGGLAIAFAAQETLQQLLGGIILYIDRPFVIDDYIGLPDGTFGRVESVGLRSTKIRNSGKGTLTIVPNSSLANMSIENFTGAKKLVSLVYLTFYKQLLEDESALIRQVILESTREIFGIDSRNTDVIFKEIPRDAKINVLIDSRNSDVILKDITPEARVNVTQAQINFFILGSGEMSMEMRRQLIDIAKQSITLQLKGYGIAFDLEERAVDVDAPITI
ncbi:MAG: mechanosensitive ion channel family protein [Gloeotrichia echinulata DVL01]|nr:mechanosensitive ion channel family protein [Gloeotrichia echinulata DEX184]